MMFLANLSAQADEWPANVSAARAFIDDKALHMGHEAIQLHGGMGVSEELAIGHYHKRLLMITTLFGNTDFHVDEFIDNKSMNH